MKSTRVQGQKRGEGKKCFFLEYDSVAKKPQNNAKLLLQIVHDCLVTTKWK